MNHNVCSVWWFREYRLSSVVVKAIDKLSDALSPKQSSGSLQGHSPAGVIENHSRCYKQLTELIFKKTEYSHQKNTYLREKL